MRPILLKRLLTEMSLVDEATIHIDSAKLNHIRKTINEFAQEYDLYDLSAFSHDIDKIRKMDPMELMRNISGRLRQYRIAFIPMNRNTGGGYSPVTGNILVNGNWLIDALVATQNKKKDAVDELVSVIEHEMIHREQHKRAHEKHGRTRNVADRSVFSPKFKTLTPSQEKRGFNKYHNDQAEVMTWANTWFNQQIVRAAYDPVVTLADAIKVINNFPHLPAAKLLTPENRKKVMRQMVDYSRKYFDEMKKR